MDITDGSYDQADTWTETDADGGYAFELPPGRHIIREVNRRGWRQTQPGADDGFRHVITLLPGGVVTNCDFGNYPLAQRPSVLKGRKFFDRNGNGEEDNGERGLPGWHIYLDENASGAYERGEPITRTGRNGTYRLLVDVGDHIVREICPCGTVSNATNWVQTLPDASMNYEYKIEVTLPGSTIDGLDFGNHLACSEPGIVSGYKFDDANTNGIWDASERPLSRWLVYVDLNHNRRVDRSDLYALTDTNGAYRFELAPGRYLVREDMRASGWKQTKPGGADNFEYKVRLTCGSDVTHRDFGNHRVAVQPGIISGQKFWDKNRDDAKGTNEPGLCGWLVYLDMNHNGEFDDAWGSHFPIDKWTRTDRNGMYRFDVRPGRYAVREVLRRGWEQTLPGPTNYQYDVRVKAGDHVRGQDFGNHRLHLYPVFGRKYADLNRNGRMDRGEKGIPHWPIYLDLNNNDQFDPAVDRWTRTDTNGYYRFRVLANGRYHLREVMPEGWMQTEPGAPGFEYTIHVPTNGIAPYDFGNYPIERPGRIHGLKFEDRNMNGRRDAGEPGLHGWAIYLDLNTNGTYDADIDQATRTSRSGYYGFTVRPGRYHVRERLRDGWYQSVPRDEYVVHVAPGELVGRLHFGNARRPSEPAVLSGVKFNDLNFNGQRDTIEPTLPHWRIYLDTNGNNRYDPLVDVATRTGDDGRYRLAVRPGTYMLREVRRRGWAQTRPDALHDHAYTVTVDAGDKVDDLDFGNHKLSGTPGRICGCKFRDLDRDGVRDRNEPGLPHWLIYLDLNQNGEFDRPEADETDDHAADRWAVTRADGRYRFDDLSAGTYHVREVIRPGWVQSLPGPPDYEHVVQLPEDADYTGVDGVDFGNYVQGTGTVYTLEGWKFYARNTNGVHDESEPGLPNWMIYLDLNTNGVYDPRIDKATRTDDHGHYALDVGVDASTFRTYVIREVLKGGWQQSYPGPEQNGEHVVRLPHELPLPPYNFANKRVDEPCGIAGRKFYDLNGNGRHDPLEHGLAGWHIYVDQDGSGTYDAGEPIVETDEKGRYRLELHPGRFVVREIMSRSYEQTLPGPRRDYAYKVALRPGVWVEDLGFGNVFWNPGELTGRKTYAGPSIPGVTNGLPGWVIYADADGDGTFTYGTDYGCVTDRGGRYRMSIPPGDYHVREVIRPAWTQVTPDGPDFGYPLAVTGGVGYADLDFANRLDVEAPAVIRGRKLYARRLRAHAPGVLQLPGLPGWTIYLDLNTNGVFDAGVDSAVRTERDGEYEFRVRAGSYTIREIVKPGWTQRVPGPSNDFAYVVTVGAGEEATRKHFVNACRDVDGDSATDYDEEIMGTQAGDAASVLAVSTTPATGGKVSLAVEAVAGRRYTLRESLALTAWSDVGSPITPTETETIFFLIDPDTDPRKFYRVEVTLPEE